MLKIFLRFILIDFINWLQIVVVDPVPWLQSMHEWDSAKITKKSKYSHLMNIVQAAKLGIDFEFVSNGNEPCYC